MTYSPSPTAGARAFDGGSESTGHSTIRTQQPGFRGFRGRVVESDAPGTRTATLAGSVTVASAPSDTGVDEVIDVAVQDSRSVAHFVFRAQVLDHLVRIEHIGAHLVSPRRLDITGQGFLFSVLLFLLNKQQPRLEHTQGSCPVLKLRLFILHCDDI